MASLKELKGRIGSVKSTQKITKAKKMVAAARLRRAQAAAEAARPYAQKLAGTVARLAARVQGDSRPALLAGTGADKVHLLLVCAADRGLAGAFNANIVKAARRHIFDLREQGKDVKLFLVGRKARAGLVRDYREAIVEYYDTSAVRQIGNEQAQEIAEKLFEHYNAGGIDVVTLFYSRFESVLTQTPTQQQLIPTIATPDSEEIPQGSAGGDPTDYEPDEESILAALLPRNITMQIYAALLENAAGEQGASMTAMDNATRNAGDLITKLTIQYNRSRQAAITTELVEIISGAEAL